MPQLYLPLNLDGFEKRKPLSQKEFEERNLDLLLAFRAIVPMCFERLNREIFPLIEPKSRDRNLASVLISGFLRGELIKTFPQYCRKWKKKRFRLVGKNEEKIYIKKLDSKKRPSNIITINQSLIINQRTESAHDKAANIFLGYTSDDMTGATGIYAVCINGDARLWCSDLNLLEGTQTTRIQISQPNEVAIKEGLVTIKKSKKSGT